MYYFILHKLQEYNIVIHNFSRYLVYSYYKILDIVPVLCFVAYFTHNSLYLFILYPYIAPLLFPVPTSNY